MSHPDPRQAPNLLVDAIRHLTGLVQKEFQLARAELSQNVSRAAVGVGFIFIAGLMLVIALNVLAGSLVGYLVQAGVGPGTAALIVAAVFIAIAIVLVLMGKSRLTVEAMRPTKTIDNIQRDVTTVKGATNG